MTTPPTPTRAKTREEWETGITELCCLVVTGTFLHGLPMALDAIKPIADDNDQKVRSKSAAYLDAIVSLQASVTKLQSENQELYQSLCSTNTQYGQLEEAEKDLRAEVERLRAIVAEVHSMVVQAGIRGEFVPTDFIRSAIEKARQPK